MFTYALIHRGWSQDESHASSDDRFVRDTGFDKDVQEQMQRTQLRKILMSSGLDCEGGIQYEEFQY
ncbi:hypothetical protein GCM10025794_29770 [Massilia kyonggiensis]